MLPPLRRILHPPEQSAGVLRQREMPESEECQESAGVSESEENGESGEEWEMRMKKSAVALLATALLNI